MLSLRRAGRSDRKSPWPASLEENIYQSFLWVRSDNKPFLPLKQIFCDHVLIHRDLSCLSPGPIQCMFEKSNNHYSWKKVTTTVHNIIVGKLWIDQVRITRPSSGTRQPCLSHAYTGLTYGKGEHTSFINRQATSDQAVLSSCHMIRMHIYCLFFSPLLVRGDRCGESQNWRPLPPQV